MPLRFNSDRAPVAFQVLQFLEGSPLFIRAGTDPQFRLTTPLHWLSDQARAVPCMHEDCPWCPRPKRYATFVPCLAYSSSARAWKQKVLPLTQRMDDFLLENLEETVWEFVRRGRRNAPVTWKLCERLKASTPFPGFDVEPSLLKMWGMWASMKRTDARPDTELGLFDGHPGDDARRTA